MVVESGTQTHRAQVQSNQHSLSSRFSTNSGTRAKVRCTSSGRSRHSGSSTPCRCSSAESRSSAHCVRRSWTSSGEIVPRYDTESQGQLRRSSLRTPSSAIVVGELVPCLDIAHGDLEAAGRREAVRVARVIDGAGRPSTARSRRHGSGRSAGPSRPACGWQAVDGRRCEDLVQQVEQPRGAAFRDPLCREHPPIHMVALTACSVVARCSTGAFLQRASARSDGIAHGSTPPPGEPGEREATTADPPARRRG